MNEIYFNTIAKSIFSFTNAQVMTLYDLATQCPNVAGGAVYKARDLYKLICDTTNFDDDVYCYGIARLSNTSANTNTSISSTVKMYPNPANNMVTFDFNETNIESTVLKIRSSLGNFIMSVNIPANETQHTIDISALTSGVYFVSIISNKKSIYYDKLIIQR